MPRYQMFLQLKQDILSGRLIPPPQISVQLSALALQCKYTNISHYSPQSSFFIVDDAMNKMISIFVDKAKIYLNLLSAELGDYDPVIHTPAFVSEFRFVPVQSEELEVEILECYKHMR